MPVSAGWSRHLTACTNDKRCGCSSFHFAAIVN
jgi:hypothetical protein